MTGRPNVAGHRRVVAWRHRQGLLELAGKYPDAIIPGYTHLRRAQAVLWPHYLLAYFEMFARDHERFNDSRRRANVMPLGSGALAGSGFPHDRPAIARDAPMGEIRRFEIRREQT